MKVVHDMLNVFFGEKVKAKEAVMKFVLLLQDNT